MAEVITVSQIHVPVAAAFADGEALTQPKVTHEP